MSPPPRSFPPSFSTAMTASLKKKRRKKIPRCDRPRVAHLTNSSSSLFVFVVIDASSEIFFVESNIFCIFEQDVCVPHVVHSHLDLPKVCSS